MVFYFHDDFLDFSKEIHKNEFPKKDIEKIRKHGVVEEDDNDIFAFDYIVGCEDEEQQNAEYPIDLAPRPVELTGIDIHW